MTNSTRVFKATSLNVLTRWNRRLLSRIKLRLNQYSRTLLAYAVNTQKRTYFSLRPGSQYTSDAAPTLLEKHGAVQSMSRKGDPLDNAVAEFFFLSFEGGGVAQDVPV